MRNIGWRSDRALPATGEVFRVEVRGAELYVGVAGDRAQRDQLLAAEPVRLLDRRELEGQCRSPGSTCGTSSAPARYTGRAGDGVGEVAEPGMFEDGADRDGAADLVAEAGDEAHREQRVAAEREEVVVRPTCGAPTSSATTAQSSTVVLGGRRARQRG